MTSDVFQIVSPSGSSHSTHGTADWMRFDEQMSLTVWESGDVGVAPTSHVISERASVLVFPASPSHVSVRQLLGFCSETLVALGCVSRVCKRGLGAVRDPRFTRAVSCAFFLGSDDGG